MTITIIIVVVLVILFYIGKNKQKEQVRQNKTETKAENQSPKFTSELSQIKYPDRINAIEFHNQKIQQGLATWNFDLTNLSYAKLVESIRQQNSNENNNYSDILKVVENEYAEFRETYDLEYPEQFLPPSKRKKKKTVNSKLTELIKTLDDQELDADSIRSVKTLLSKEGGASLVETLINEGIISSKDIVNTSFRKRGLQIFKKLKDNPEYWKTYADENSIKKHSEEKVWQYFFEKNQWIFGYGLDYRYQKILQREVHLSDAELDGSNTVIGDYLLGDNFFTTFIELKKPTTPLFGNKGNRSNSWKLSNDLIESVSQILEHKASGLIRIDKQQYIKGEPIEQKAYDSKVILIIGDWKELDKTETTLEKEIKKKTFELFRRDSRNVEILTFDELYERAHFIVEGEKVKKEEPKIVNEDDDDLPF